MKQEIEPWNVIVIDNVETMLDAIWMVQTVTNALQDLLELLLRGVGSPNVDPVLDHLGNKNDISSIC